MLGVLMLDTSFERIPGDIGHPASFDYPVVYATVRNASIQRVVKESDSGLVQLFIDAGLQLERQGATAITTSCGFLARFQREIQDGLNVPFCSSSLLQIPKVQRAHGQVGIITARESSLEEAHFVGAGCAEIPSAIIGMDSSPAFTDSIVEQLVPVNEAAIRKEVEVVTKRLIEQHPGLNAIVLECTNLPPYADSVRRISGLPIYDALSMCDALITAAGSGCAL